jgi:hypothetical protein
MDKRFSLFYKSLASNEFYYNFYTKVQFYIAIFFRNLRQ